MSSCKQSPCYGIDFDDNMAEGRVGSYGATLIRWSYCHILYVHLRNTNRGQSIEELGQMREDVVW